MTRPPLEVTFARAAGVSDDECLEAQVRALEILLRLGRERGESAQRETMPWTPN